jgi:hypothetical protein
MGMKTLATALAVSMAVAAPAHAVVGFADVVFDYLDSGAGPIAGPYGGTLFGAFPVPVTTDVVLGPEDADPDFLSLPTRSYVTVGFLDEQVFDRVGDDIFVGEVGSNGETAQVFVSNDLVNFFLLGVATDGGVNTFDLADIGWVGQVNAIRVVGQDLGGASPGFDLTHIEVLAVPEPATWAMMILGFGAVGALARRRMTFATA